MRLWNAELSESVGESECTSKGRVHLILLYCWTSPFGGWRGPSAYGETNRMVQKRQRGGPKINEGEINGPLLKYKKSKTFK